jgi:hypothetical protein
MNLELRSVPLILIPLLCISVLFAGEASADPVADPTLGDRFDAEWVLVFVGCSLLETAVIGLFLSRSESVRTRIAVSAFFFVINIVTMSSLNYLDYYYINVLNELGTPTDQLIFLIALELAVIIIESGLLYLFFGYHRKRGLLKGAYSVRSILVMVVASNLASFFAEVLYTSFAH